VHQSPVHIGSEVAGRGGLPPTTAERRRATRSRASLRGDIRRLALRRRVDSLPRMSGTLFRPEAACGHCGAFGAYEFDGETLCLDCYQGCGSCCSERVAKKSEPVASERPAAASLVAAPAPPRDTHRVSANCCYQACPGCSHLRKLREFRSAFPADWQTRLRGLPRIVGLATESA